MKKVFLFSSLCAAMLLTGCKSEEPAAGSGNNGELGEPQFLTVNLVTNTTNGTRGNFGDPEDDENNKSEYENGLADENKVEKVRFYFFKANGQPAKVSNATGTLTNWLDWTNISEEGKDEPNVEKILSATLIIQTPQGDDAELATHLVAVINPTDDAKEGRSLSSIQEVVKNYQNYTTSGSFVMSNATYASNNAKTFAVEIQGKLHSTSAEALADPVQVYVERTVAKVRLGCSLTPLAGTDNIFATSTAQKPQTVKVNGEDTEIYVKFLGWNTTAVANMGLLIKNINPTWEGTLLGGSGMPWNWADYHRSFWAANPSDDAFDYLYGAFNTTDGKIWDKTTHEYKDATEDLFVAVSKTKFDKSQWVYINENATDEVNLGTGANPSNPTKVIIAGQLVDKDGKQLEFAEYGDTRTTVDGLLDLFANNSHLYKKTVIGEGADMKTTFSKITPEDLIIKTATAVEEDKAGRYKSYVQLKVNEDDVWYTSNTDTNAKPIKAKEANEALLKLGSAKVWTNGYTYYYFDIQHIGDKIGVVRNHIYDATISSLAGLGTPVYDPEEVIYPEKPKDDPTQYIAAQINILSWRVVRNDAVLDWNTPEKE